MPIHPTAIVERKARVAESAEIGPYCIVGESVTLRRNVRLLSHVVIGGVTDVGEDTVIHAFANVGVAGSSPMSNRAASAPSAPDCRASW